MLMFHLKILMLNAVIYMQVNLKFAYGQKSVIGNICLSFLSYNGGKYITVLTFIVCTVVCGR